MKKNIFLSILALASMLFATSCSQDELFNESTNGDFVNATFTIGTADGIGTRAVGDGTTVDKVACAVYDADGVELKDLYKVENVAGKTATYNVRLAKGQNYRIAFFAYNEAAGAYDVTDLKNIIVKDDGTLYIIDWSHATQGNASADVARTYLLFWLSDDVDGANKYLDLYCEKSGVDKKYVQSWLPIVAASQSVKGHKKERELLLSWVNVVDYE